MCITQRYRAALLYCAGEKSLSAHSCWGEGTLPLHQSWTATSCCVCHSRGRSPPENLLHNCIKCGRQKAPSLSLRFHPLFQVLVCCAGNLEVTSAHVLIALSPGLLEYLKNHLKTGIEDWRMTWGLFQNLPSISCGKVSSCPQIFSFLHQLSNPDAAWEERPIIQIIILSSKGINIFFPLCIISWK